MTASIAITVACAAGLFLLYMMVCSRMPALIFSVIVAYSAITKSVSVFYIEQSQWFLSETAVVSSNIGATSRNLTYNFIIFFSAAITILIAGLIKGRKNRAAAPGSDSWRLAFWVMIFVCLVAVLAQTLNVASSGMAFGGSRHLIWQAVKLPVLRDILGILIAFVPAIGGVAMSYSIIQREKHKLMASVAVLGSYFLYLVVSGQGFNGLLFGAIVAAAPVFAIFNAYGVKLPLKRLYILSGCLIAGLILTSAEGLGQRSISQFGGGTTAGTIAYRAFVLQGGVYYTADYRVYHGAGHQDGNILLGGMEETIRALAPTTLAEAYIRKGVNLAGSLPGNAILVFGYWWAAPVMILYGFILGVMCLLLMRACVSYNLPAVLFGSYAMVWISSVYARGSFDALLDPRCILFIVVTLVLNNVSYSRDRFMMPEKRAARTSVRA